MTTARKLAHGATAMILVATIGLAGCSDDEGAEVPAEGGAPETDATSGDPTSSDAPTTTVAGLVNDSVAVSIVDFDYNPLTIIIEPGQSVVWTNDGDSAHAVTAENDGFTSSERIGPDEQYIRNFDEPGTYPYYCSFHGRDEMIGTVIVEEPTTDETAAP